MLGSQSVDEDRLNRHDSEKWPENHWHNPSPLPAPTTQTHPTEEVESSGPSRNLSGTWGEHDVGRLDEAQARHDYTALTQELSRMESHKSHKSRESRSASRARAPTATSEHAPPQDDKSEDDFQLDDFVRQGYFEKRTDNGSNKRVGVIFKNLTVKGVGSNTTFVRTFPDAVIGTFGPDLYYLVCRFIPALARRTGALRTLVNDFTGCVRDGEMMLVLGRPGAGCTTFLKAVSNSRQGYAEVTGDVTYGGISAEKQKKMYRGEVNYNPEDDLHFPALNVWQTFSFALMNKTKKKLQAEIPIIADALLKMFGIPHTKYTLVGNEFTRGVSGGERKRVSIAETLATKSSVVAWDNSTRGLDASTALDYARSLRIMTDISNRTTLVTLYQAGEGIYDVFDKVLVIDSGRQIFTGRRDEARQYFIDLGFQAPDRQTTADFLTAVTDPVERRFRPGCEASTPKTPEALERAFRESPHYQKVLDDIKDYEDYLQRSNFEDAKRFENAVQESKSKYVRQKSPYTVSFSRQVLACVKREYWLIAGDLTTLKTKAFIIVSNALIVGSLFYGESLDTEGAFARGGALFFSILFLGWLQLSELIKAVSGRDVVLRHSDYALYRPSAVSIARVVIDFPIIAIQSIVFGTIMYFMSSLDIEAGKFFIYLLFIFITVFLLTSLYRMFGSVSPQINSAVRFSGIALNLLVIYTGYVIPKPQLLSNSIWFGWLTWINPLSYSFEAVLANEFSGRTMQCSPAQLVPQGPNVDPACQGCALSGAQVNSRSVSGDAYLGTTYTYTRAHLWRNFGVVIAFIVLYILVTVIATETFNFAGNGGGALVFKKSKRAKREAQKLAAPVDEEKASDSGNNSLSNKETSLGELHDDDKGDDELKRITKSDSIFTWQNISYTVPYLGGQKQLLNNVSGYAKPGLMVALMGASGAGKTTLLNTLSQRQATGVVAGDMFVDGRPLGPGFQRSTGFCLQGDIHDGTATIREALEFSALLRQPASVPRAEKIAYVDQIINLLEMDNMQDAIISSLGVEQRKRLTIGVELAAKPSLLLFLDEPTSGLDSQSAYSIIRFLKKLSRAGQAIVCTIHQPSSVLIQQFDMILALNPGGNAFYFGPVGENGRAVIDYFGARGVHCPPTKNVAEFILETAAKPTRRADGTKIDWNEEWRTSEEAVNVTEEIEGLKLTRSRTIEAEKRKEDEREFASSTWTQTKELTKRTFRQYWRDSSYLYGKVFCSFVVAIFNGFTFWQLGNSTQDMQDRLFTAFMIVVLPPTFVNLCIPKFFGNMMVWMGREYPSRIYGWQAFTTAQVVAEIPPAIFCSFIYWVIWYWPTGLPSESSVSGYVFLMTMLFFCWMSSFGQFICAFAPSCESRVVLQANVI